MNSQPPPLKQPGWFQRHGCLLVLAFVFTGLVAAVLLTWYMITRTAMPFKAVAAAVEDAFPGVKVKGVGGNISAGPTVDSITWGDDPANPSGITGLRIKYNSIEDIRDKKQLILTEVGASKVRIDLADFEEFSKEVRAESTTSPGATPGRRSSRRSKSSTSSSSANAPSPLTELGLQNFEIKQMLIEDVLITNRNTGFRLSIPKVQWTGFQATPSSFEIGDLVIESDRLSLRTAPGQRIPLEGNVSTPKRTLTGTIQPLMHAAILKPIRFTVEFAFVPEKTKPSYEIRAADDAVQIVSTEDGGRTLRASHLEAGAFFDAAKLYGKDAADFPVDLVLEVVETAEHKTRIIGGSFRLGVAAFQIEPGEFDEDTEEPEISAVTRAGPGTIRWKLPLANWPEEYRPTFSSTAKSSPNEILARVFKGKKYADLTPEEQQAIDARVPAYFPQ